MAGVPFGKYLLHERIAAGGMAEIYRAKYVAVAGVTKTVVIKKILPHYAGNRNFISMFVNEAKIAVGLSHGNIAQIFDFGEIDGEYYLAMEYVHGQTVSKLQRRARENGIGIPVPFAVFIAMELTKGLHYAHTRTDDAGRPLGIVHRDVSPQNVIISYEGQVKIVDFGIAKARKAGEDADKTQAGAIKGKYVYFSPEQARARDLDARTDVYASGCVLFEMLCGRLPFEGKMIEVLNKIVRGDFPRPSTLNPDIPPKLEAIILKSMATDREQRYASGQAMQEALADFLHTNYPSFTQGALANLVSYLFAEELQAEGREVSLPASFLEQVKAWKEAPRPRERSGERAQLETSVERSSKRGTRAETLPLEVVDPVSRTGTAFLDNRLKVGLALGGFLGTALLAGGVVVLLGRARLTGVRVESNVPAKLTLDGRPTGKTTPATEQRLASGVAHSIELTAPGMKPWRGEATPASGEVLEVIATLEPEGASDARPALPKRPTGPEGNAVDELPERPAAPVAEAPQGELELEGNAVTLSIPASHAARVRLDPRKSYRLGVEGSAVLGGLNNAYVTRGCFYFLERDKGAQGPAWGYLGPKDAVKVSGARVLYGFVVDDTPDDNLGALSLVARPEAGAPVRLKVDARSNIVWPDGLHGGRFTRLPAGKRLQLELRGAMDQGGHLGKSDRVVYWYDGLFNLFIQGRSTEADHGVLRVGERVVLESPSQVVLFVPDDDTEDNHGALTASLHPAPAEAAPKKPQQRKGR